MDITKLEKEIDELNSSLDTKRMGDRTAAEMETIEKRLNSRISILSSGRLKELGTNILNLVSAIRDGIISNEKLADKTKTYYESLKTWSIVLGIATVCLVFVGGCQAWLLNIYTRETQKLSRVAQEQLDLQLQPALMINTQGFIGSSYEDLTLVNIGNGAALNIHIYCDDKTFNFVDIPDFLEAKAEKNLYYNDVGHLKRSISFAENKELKIRLDYENINNKKYFTEVIVSSKGARLFTRGEVEISK